MGLNEAKFTCLLTNKVFNYNGNKRHFCDSVSGGFCLNC